MTRKPELTLLEKVVVNIATPFDFLVEMSRLKDLFGKTRGEYSPYVEKFKAIIYSKIDKTRKLIRIKNRYNGEIPERIEKICRKTLCGSIRLLIAYEH